MDKEKSKNFKDCEICKSDASCICYECQSYFCEKCYKVIHEGENVLQHKKEKVDIFIPIILKCPEHSKEKISLFCLEEKSK